MILILSTDSDYTTRIIIKWLNKWNIPVIRLNDNDILRYDFKIYFENNELKFFFKLENISFTSDDISVVWFRKFGFMYQYEGAEQIKKRLGLDYFYKVLGEYNKTLGLITKILADRHWLCHYKSTGLNKIDVLSKAKSLGIKVPETVLTNASQYILNGNNCKVITKSIGDIMRIDLNDNQIITALTSDFTGYKRFISKNFFPSLIQEKIIKNFEIRSFFLDGKFYSMAIFSQNNKKTETDFRNYDKSNPNRFVPYKLPFNIEKKLKLLMKNLNLNTGSLDLIFSTEGEYIFLEVNPAGQFGMVSDPCNYQLEEKVANYLRKKYLLKKNMA